MISFPVDEYMGHEAVQIALPVALSITTDPTLGVPLILDIRLPGKSGIDVLKDIRAKKLPSRVIMMTNYPYPQYRKKCEELGADYFFDKVTEIEEIPKVIEELAKNKPEKVKIEDKAGSD